MRKFVSFSVLFLLSAFILPKNSSAQLKVMTVCFNDGFGYKWTFTNLQMTGDNSYYAEGTLDNAYSVGRATMWLNLTNGLSGSVEIHGINAAADGCYSASDSFVYVGSAVITRSGGVTTGYSGSGSWTSYCFGSALNSGTWAAAGPCGSSLQAPKAKEGQPQPAQPKMKGNALMVKVSPNPVRDYAHLEYRITDNAKVNISVYDIHGLPVKTLVNENKAAGTYNYSWNLLNNQGSKCAPGIYKVVINNGQTSSFVNVQVL